jgi:hypothetical protein
MWSWRLRDSVLKTEDRLGVVGSGVEEVAPGPGGTGSGDVDEKLWSDNVE